MGLRRGDSSLCPFSLLCLSFSSSQLRPILKSSVRLPFCIPVLSRRPEGVTSPHCDVPPLVPRCLTGVCASEVCGADRPPSTPSFFVLMKPNTSKHLLFYKRGPKGFSEEGERASSESTPGSPPGIHASLSSVDYYKQHLLRGR